MIEPYITEAIQCEKTTIKIPDLKIVLIIYSINDHVIHVTFQDIPDDV
jgi:hypothetical protein